ncbi:MULTISPECIES: acetyl-CoA carboxylase biotin carboxyl carrier protein [Clostridium]|uniref:acetyl-CoA carboxylase biotin carboxyl carrier protein n=1 Tax=Clostridium TaxID=1485 RepID=UPI0008253116|nr:MULTISPECIES: biotin/lipoyl-containing protein [Clostridium]PJI08625.1 acetyl-CoA carboxylase biotin carboxyl carrier protein subunit [Clostridium sp. CT7]
MIDTDDLAKIMELLKKQEFSHFEFKCGDSKIVMDRGSSTHTDVSENENHNKGEIALKRKHDEKIYIKSSLAGTFYRGKEEGKEAFIKFHDIVKEDTVVGLIEVMKLYNEIEAGISGEIVDILVEDGEFVEYGQPLFEIKGSDK